MGDTDCAVFVGNAKWPGVLLMKLKAGSSLFNYDSTFWTDSNTVNSWETVASPSDDVDAKLESFNSKPIRALHICYKTLTNCYEYKLGFTATSARDLFSGGYRRSNDLGGKGRRAFTDIFLPPGDKDYDTFWHGGSGTNCNNYDLLNPGINSDNSVNGDHNQARIGYAVRQPRRTCETGDSDGAIGIGLTTYYVPHSINAPFGGGTVNEDGTEPVNHYHQAWLFGSD